jgi:6-pyruvoyltetrahydropterin/6-carboxytetrahydropterin synthase
MPYRITRTHEIDAGHRVAGHESKCAHLHGHRYQFALTCEAFELDRIGRVIDFSVMKETLCRWLDDNWDHRMLIWEGDPWLGRMRDIDPSVVVLPCNPTAENLAVMMVELIAPVQLSGTGVRLVACTVHETAKCSASYELHR